MSATLALFRSEVRRNLPSLAVALALVAAVAVLGRAMGHDGPYRDGAWALNAARFAVLLLGPVLGAERALHSWSAERADGTLAWLYARPLAATRIFIVRAAAIYLAQATLVVAALAANGVAPSRFWRVDDVTAHSLMRLGLMLLIGSVPFGLFFAAVSSQPGRALAGLVLVAPWLWLGAMGLGFRILGEARWGGSGSSGLLASSAAALGAAWWAVRRTPADRRRLRRGWSALLIGLAASSLLAAAWSRLPPSYLSRRVVAVRSLGEGADLHWQRQEARWGPAYVPFLIDGRDRPRPAGGATAVVPAASTDRASGRTMVAGADAVWRILERGGRTLATSTPADGPGSTFGIVGWSPTARHFAWRSPYRKSLGRPAMLIAEATGEVREVPLDFPPEYGDWGWNALWLDDRTVLLASDWTHVDAKTAQPPRRVTWWGTLDVDGGGESELRHLPFGWRLETPAPVVTLHPGDPREVVAVPPPRRRGALVLWLTDGATSRLVTLADPSRGLEPLVETAAARRDTLGALDDGELVWIERRPEVSVVVALAADGDEPRRACELPGDFPPWIFRGAAGRWVLWAEQGDGETPGTRLLGCQLDSGAVRVLDRLGPLGFLSVDVAGRGVLGLRGWIDLEGAEP